MAMMPTGKDVPGAKDAPDSDSRGVQLEALPNPSVHPVSLRSFVSFKAALMWALGAIAVFYVAYVSPRSSGMIAVYLVCLLQLARTGTGRQAFYIGLGVGLLIAASQLYCFWVIFGPSAIALWVVLGFWIGLFVALARLCLLRFGDLWGALLISFLWTGLEYFRSELYYLRFSWLNIGYAFSGSALLPIFRWVGMYGVGFIFAGLASILSSMLCKRWLLIPLLAAILGVPLLLPFNGASNLSTTLSVNSLQVAGAQLEFGSEADVLTVLDKLLLVAPGAELLMLSEYTLDGPVPDKIKAWCREHRRYLVVGGKDPAPGSNFYDTAFVVGPPGDIIFRQGKSVPIQFFRDGLPAREQALWESPWGKIGICICYDLSYTRVTDRLIRLGAQAVLVPTMDVMDWGSREHELHAMVAPVRAAEYGVPIFRVASSGISQFVDRRGHVIAKAGFPGQQEILVGRLAPANSGSVPLDRILAPLATLVTTVVIVWALVSSLFPGRTSRGGHSPGTQQEPGCILL